MQTGIKPPALLNPPSVPAVAVHVWQWFGELGRQRGSNGFGFAPLSFADMSAYFGLRGIVPYQWELDLLLDFDALFLSAMNSETQEIGSFAGV